MANVPISGLPATTPTNSDEVPVNQAGVTSKVTIADILAIPHGLSFPLLAPETAVGSPSYAFSETGNDTGFGSPSDGVIEVSTNGALSATFTTAGLTVVGDLAAANYPPVGNANNTAYFDGTGHLAYWPGFQRDTNSGGLNTNLTIQPNNTGGLQIHQWSVSLDPLQNSPNDGYNIFNINIQLDPNSTGFSFGTNGQAATILNGGFNHAGTGSIGGLSCINFSSNLGNGTDPITIKYLNGVGIGAGIAANVTLDGQVQAYSTQYNFNAASSGTSNFSLNLFSDYCNVNIPVNGYNLFDVGANISEITNNHNYNGFSLHPTVTNLAGNAGFFGLVVSPNIGTINNGTFIGVSVNPTITLNKSNVTGLDVNMNGVTNFAGGQSFIVVQDLTLTFNNFSDNNNITLEYVNDGTAGSETANFSNPHIVVHIQSGVSTATQVKAALDANFTISTNIATTISGVGSNAQVTFSQTNFAGGANPATKRAANFNGDVNIQGALAFTGALTVGQINAFAPFTVVSGAGVASIDTLITAPAVPASATITGTDLLAINTASLMNIGNNASVTTSFLGFAALGLPAVLSMGTGSTIDRVGGAVFALSLDGAATGGTADIVSLCRALALPNGVTTVNRLYGYEMATPFGAVGTLAWGSYINADVDNWFKQSIKIGGTAGSTDVVANASVGLELESNTKAILLSRMTTTERDALIAINGMLIYNTTTDKFQGYENGAWVNLV